MTTTRRDAIKGAVSILATRVVVIPASAGAIVGLQSCGGGGGDSGPPAPSALSYSGPIQGTANTAITPLSPTVTGTVNSYAVSPALPAGITLNAATGVISGTPTAAVGQTAYTVTASNASGSTTYSLSISIKAAFAITGASSVTPTALTPISLSTTGLDVTANFTVTLQSSTGYNVTLTPIRTASDGTVVVAAPLYIDPTTGNTAPLAATVQISQGSMTSNALTINVSDIPATATYGTTPGQISRTFLTSQELYFALSVNAYQAMRALQTSKTDTTTLQQHLTQQQISAVEARDNIDVIVSGGQTALALGQATSGTADPVRCEQR